MTLRVASLALLLACQPTDEDPCRPGTVLAADGHCYPPLEEPAETLDAVLENGPACEPGLGPQTIDLGAGCVAGACAGDTLQAWTDQLGEPDCATTSFDSERAYCTWPQGIDGLYDDPDEDGQPDPEATSSRVHVFAPFDGTGPGGMGVHRRVSCFVDALGVPDRVLHLQDGGELVPEELHWDSLGLSAYDWTDLNGAEDHDGALDNLYLFGPQ